MDDRFPTTSAAGSLSQDFERAGAEIARVTQQEIVPAAGQIETAFTTAAKSIERELGRAARSGEGSLKSLANALVRDLGRVAIDGLVRRPLRSFLTQAFSAPFGGARSNGGPVGPNTAVLVGERGPEMFVPGTSGKILPGTRAGGSMVVNITLPGVRNRDDFAQSQTQIAVSLARVVGRGQRNL
ncbi:MAG: phage tail tape measure C-terminal domain-containing protein [Pseudomonadota bacterium]